jgi:hypothetical protein
MLNFIICVLALRIVLSVGKYTWTLLLRIAHPEWAKVKQDYTLEPTVNILLPCLAVGPRPDSGKIAKYVKNRKTAREFIQGE